MQKEVTPEAFQMALSGDVLSIEAITEFTVAEIHILKELGFGAGQIVWYGGSLLTIDGPADLDGWEEQQRILCGSDSTGLCNPSEYDPNDEDNYTGMY